jgi:hypothetical protein
MQRDVADATAGSPAFVWFRVAVASMVDPGPGEWFPAQALQLAL